MTRLGLAVDREGVTHKVRIRGLDGFITVNCDGDGNPREVFLHGFGNFGVMMAGWCDTFAIMLSFALQHDVSLTTLAEKFARQYFEPYGQTDDAEIPYCYSIPDYVLAHLVNRYGDDDLKKSIAKLRERELPA